MTSPTDDRRRRRFDYPATVQSIAVARREISEFVLDRLQTPGDAGDAGDDRSGALVKRLQVVVSELTSNAVEAAPGCRYRVEVLVVQFAGNDTGTPSGALVECTVTSPLTAGADLDRPMLGIPAAPLAERGRGLGIVDALSDRCRIDATDGELSVVTEFDLIS